MVAFFIVIFGIVGTTIYFNVFGALEPGARPLSEAAQSAIVKIITSTFESRAVLGEPGSQDVYGFEASFNLPSGVT